MTELKGDSERDKMTAEYKQFFSHTFDNTGKIEIGLKLLGRSLAPDLCKGTTVASFHVSVKIQEMMDAFTMCKI